jgi:hypothetical protein
MATDSRRSSTAVSAPVRALMAAKSMFSSWPDAALVAGVKMTSGSRAACRSPGGSAIPQTAPVFW